MSEKLHLQLDEQGDWFLGADSLQWILLRRRPVKGDVVFQPKKFLPHTKENLFRVIGQCGISLIDKAKDTIDSFPDTFLKYATIHHPKSGKGRKKSVDT